MNKEEFKDIVSQAFSEPEIIEISIKIYRSIFDSNQESVSDLHRKISNSKQIIANVSNRNFWKQKVEGGFYQYMIGEKFVYITYYLTLKDSFTTSDLNNIKTRIKKVIHSQVDINTNPTHIKMTNDNDNRMYAGIRFIGKFHQNQANMQNYS